MSTLRVRRTVAPAEKLDRKQTNIPKSDDSNEPTLWQQCLAYTILLSSVSFLVFTYLNWQEATITARPLSEFIRIPRTVGDARAIGSLILSYKDEHYYSVFGVYFASYILLQSLCIPGSIVLSILAGYLFPAPLALLIICTCSTLGASTFYIIIYNKKHLLLKLLTGGSTNRLDKFNNFVQAKIKEYKSNLFLCVFLLRATPVFPNWTINLCSPMINLPLKPFVLGTFTGVAPLSVIHVWTGRILNDMSSDQSLVNWQSVLMTSLVAISIGFLVYMRQKI